jgi:hypothetical protein
MSKCEHIFVLNCIHIITLHKIKMKQMSNGINELSSDRMFEYIDNKIDLFYK